MTTRFFVYGSMTEGLVHWSKISQYVQSSMPARVRASAWRLPVGYPVLLRGGVDKIVGTLLELKASDILLSLLDEFHGFSPFDAGKSLHVREEEVIYTESGEETRAWVYFLNPRKLPTTAKLIPEGDWVGDLKQAPALTEKLTERQRTYLLKLAAVTGREVVPINDMSLYRELMGLELIVDKGRRLALSGLGREVVRYLA